MMLPRIVVTNPIADEVAARLAEVGEVEINPALEPWSAAGLAERLADATVMMGFMTDCVDEALLARAPRLRLVACALKGYEAYDTLACERAGVWVSNVPDLLTEPTAELAIGLAIGLGRHVRAGDAYVRSGAFRGWRAHWYGRGLAGAQVAVVGLGPVGRAIVDRLQGFGCETIWGVDPAAHDARVRPTSLAGALGAADIVFVAAPLTAETCGMIDAAALAQARPGQLIVNVGRGSVVDEAAIANALDDGRLGGYAADVFAFEDWALPGRPRAVPERLIAHPATLFTPHLGSAVREVRLAIEHRAADNIVAVLQGRVPPDAVNQPAGAAQVGRAAA